MSASLAQAITQLRLDIETTGYSDELLEQVSWEFEVKPPLLKRKFTEQFGIEPAMFVPPKKAEFSAEYLDKRARKLWDNYRLAGRPEDHPMFGREFTHEGEPMIAVAYMGTRLLVLSKDTARYWVISWPSRHAAYVGLENMGLVK
jgi:hypothetical protein